MATESATKMLFARLKGAENYIPWNIRAKSALRRQNVYHCILRKFEEIVDEDEDLSLLQESAETREAKRPTAEEDQQAKDLLILLLEDGPLQQIQYLETAYEIWKQLERLYNPKGFTSTFLICKEFFSLRFEDQELIEDFINKLKRLLDELKSREITLPDELILT